MNQKRNMHKQTIFITGATSGIGKFAVCELASKGAKIIATARTFDKGNNLLDFYNSNFPAGKGTIEIVECDLSSFNSIKRACAEVREKYNTLDQLILNAGVWNFEFKETVDGIEEIFQVNFLSTLLLIEELKSCLQVSYEAKIILTASALHQGTINFPDIEFRENYSGIKAYRQSKLALILLCRALNKKLSEEQIGIYCLHPGIVRTNLGRHANWLSRSIFKLIGRNPEKGARTLLFLAKSSKQKLNSGSYYVNGKRSKSSEQSYNLEIAEKLIAQARTYLKLFL